MMNTLTYFDHTPQVGSGTASAGRGDNKPQEIALAKEIAGLPGLTREERLGRWQERTGLSRPTYYRRLAEGRLLA
jgi:hypothetical protein